MAKQKAVNPTIREGMRKAVGGEAMVPTVQRSATALERAYRAMTNHDEWWYCPVCACVYSLPGTCHNKYKHLNRPRLHKLRGEAAVAASAGYALTGRDAVHEIAKEVARAKGTYVEEWHYGADGRAKPGPAP